ncbi:uncharacterized protein [Leptinotarsa decemlineata]|uniref:uncharacterized protein n=1 Tax=Leptinotarsa decemlineata TaxID=7539 RepID=UPI003D3086B8
MESPEKYSIMQEIKKTEEAVKSTYERIEKLEQKLRAESLPENKQRVIELELLEVRKLLKTHEDQLTHLRTHNRKTFIFVVALMFVVFTVYMLYVLVGGE